MPKKKKKSNKSPLLIINIAIAIFLVIILALLTNQFILKSDYEASQVEAKNKQQESLRKQQLAENIEKEQALLFEEKTNAMEIEYHNFIEPTIANTSIEKTITLPKVITNFPKQKEEKKIKQLPKLAIIIDDVTSQAHINKINKIPYPVTMAFLPPTSRHKNSAKISKNIDTYMIHLPLEAGSRKFEETKTLYTTDSLETIENRIIELKKLYPKATYINNHTGSKFTANSASMDKLLKILKKYNYIFVDSRTTAKTETKQYAKKHNLRYLSRNIFLDNKQDKKYIQKQLRKAVRIAKKNGFSIAIGHPHSLTLKTLAQSKHLLQGLEIILINKL